MPSVLLALSGGGYRAMLFHVGALWKLNEIGELRHLSHVSSVSGGSITAGVLAMNWPRLQFANGVATNFQDQIAGPLTALAGRTLQYRAGIFSVLPFCSATRALETLYARFLFGHTTLGSLPDSPRFTFNATNLQTGASWTFERDTMGDVTLGGLPSGSVPLARAVAASSAFPPFLAPLVLTPRAAWDSYAHQAETLRSYDDLSNRPAQMTQEQVERFRKRVVLADGGIADNLGVLPVWRSNGDLYISDGGGVSRPKDHPAHNWLVQLIRTLDLIHDQPSQLRANRIKAEMANRDQQDGAGRSPREHGDGAVWDMHWPPQEHGRDPEFPRPEEKDWADLARTPTRLRAMSQELQRRLINWGYLACNRSLPYVARLFGKGDSKYAAFAETLPFGEQRTRV